MKPNHRLTNPSGLALAVAATALVLVMLSACGGGSAAIEASPSPAPAPGLLQYSMAVAAQNGQAPPSAALQAISNPPRGDRLDAVAACPQITSWSNQDADFFSETPALRVTRVEHDNTPLARSYYLPSSETRDVLATFFSMTASTTYTRDLRVANNLRVQILSYASEAKAIELFGRERAGFINLNPGWMVAGNEPNNYLILYAEGEPSTITDYPGQIQGMFLLRNSIAFLSLRSASAAESMSTTGLSKLIDRLVQARALVDGRCGGSVTNHPPTIELWPSQDRAFFQQAMVSRTTLANRAHPGISIKVTDADGRADVDWSTLRISIAGVDQTGNALQVINRLVEENRVQVVSTGTSDEYFLNLDPNKLMGSHNMFNISWNGDWPIRLRICDKRGACTQQDYSRYFGPFIDVWGVGDMHCSQASEDELQMSLDWGNNGYAAKSNFYIALADASKPTLSVRWFLAFGQASPFNEFVWWEDWPTPHALLPTTMPLSSGESNHAYVVFVPSRVLRYGAVSGNFALPDGKYKFIHGAMDFDQGAYHLATLPYDLTLCP